MKIFKKVISIIMASVIMVTALCISVSADEYSSAKLVNSGSKVTFQLKAKEYMNDGRTGFYEKDAIPHYFKIELSKKGTLKLDVVSATSKVYIQVIDEEGAELFQPTDFVETTGNVINQRSRSRAEVHWEHSIKKSKATLNYKLDKGVYYIKIDSGNITTIAGKTSLTFTYPQTKSDNEEAKLSHFALSLNEGDSIQLDTVISGSSDSSVKWSSSKSSVASVSSKGKVTAKKKGSAVITAKLGSSSIKIKINVK